MTSGVEKGWDGNGNSMAVERVCVCVSVNRAAQKERGMRSPVTRGWAECAAAPGAPVGSGPSCGRQQPVLEVLRVIADGRALWYQSCCGITSTENRKDRVLKP